MSAFDPKQTSKCVAAAHAARHCAFGGALSSSFFEMIRQGTHAFEVFHIDFFGFRRFLKTKIVRFALLMVGVWLGAARTSAPNFQST
jgi:hypothetical protein